MSHSDTISLTISRCCLNTPAPTCLRVHTHARARAHARTQNVFFQLQQMFLTVHMCHRYRVCVRVYISFIQKCFSAVRGRCNMRTYDLPLVHKHILVSFKGASTQKSQTYRYPLLRCVFFIFTAASIIIISKASPREPLWETPSSKPCKPNIVHKFYAYDMTITYY